MASSAASGFVVVTQVYPQQKWSYCTSFLHYLTCFLCVGKVSGRRSKGTGNSAK
uniref:Uncharacterized protein n=1 Tax=Anguilla anguilla TaxID=7936 RepID=A0A0E9VCR4_ANGAN